MPNDLSIKINGVKMRVASGTTVAAAMLEQNAANRISVTGEARSALCGMGICFECRATIDGVAHRRTCQTACVDGMSVETER